MPYENKRATKRIEDSFLVQYSVRAPIAVHVRVGNKPLDAVATDISEGGMGILTNLEIPANTCLGLHFNISNDAAIVQDDEFRTFDVEGDVRYALVEGNGFRLGMCFRQIEESDRSFIEHYIQTTELKRLEPGPA